MCGITGFLTPLAVDQVSLEIMAGRMTDRLAHRGPDGSGVWADAGCGITLGHRRLSVLDLSSAGSQPMHSANERYVITFNGEIYNHRELRAELYALGAASAWRGDSDTETLLGAIQHWGVDETLRRVLGMFAMAIWDRQSRTLVLARDRYGEKPLYYGMSGAAGSKVFVFGSELKALCAYPGFDNPVLQEALSAFLRFSYVPTPLSIYSGIYKLEPGSCLFISFVNGTPQIITKRYYSLAEAFRASLLTPIKSDMEAIHELEETLTQAVQSELISDVPLGVFLSGGVDSSTIAALMQVLARRNGQAPVKTFTIGFEEIAYDESPYAAAVAKHLGTDHTELKVNAAEAMAVIPKLAALYDEPFADSSQIPTYLISKLARQCVTVALSGDGGDELFGGYNRYVWAPRVWRKARVMPPVVRRWIIRAVFAMKTDPSLNLKKLLVALDGASSIDDVYWNLVTNGQMRDEDRLEYLAGFEQSPELAMMFQDTRSYLPDDILVKVDRAAMGVSLETRIPFLDRRVVELAWRLPLNLKIRNGQTKWALRQVLYKHVPKELVERPKAGFAIPVGQWLRGSLRQWAEDGLSESRLKRLDGHVDIRSMRRLWGEHIAGRRDHTVRLWNVLMLQSWIDQTKPRMAA